MITAITPTGDRHVALKLCARWMANQEIRPDQWLVIDDGKAPYDPGGCEYVRREPQPDDPKHTLNTNIEFAIPYIKGDHILIIEDDEYYHPKYVKVMAARLRYNEIVGIGCSKYYHLPTKGFARHANIAHASFAQTGFNSDAIPKLKACLEEANQNYLDVRLWSRYGGGIRSGRLRPGWENIVGDKALVFDDSLCPLYVGIKGLVGRPGIGIGHRQQTYKTHDTDLSILQSWILIEEDFLTYCRLGGYDV